MVDGSGIESGLGADGGERGQANGARWWQTCAVDIRGKFGGRWKMIEGGSSFSKTVPRSVA